MFDIVVSLTSKQSTQMRVRVSVWTACTTLGCNRGAILF